MFYTLSQEESGDEHPNVNITEYKYTYNKSVKNINPINALQTL
jgi:hypothetical protein